MEPRQIIYRFEFSAENTREFTVNIDTNGNAIQEILSVELPEWTDLGFAKCSHCPLQDFEHAKCPLAVQIVQAIEAFQAVISFDHVCLSVVTEERTITQSTSVQRALSSLMGLLMATSGCPYTDYFKPMALFHLPLASADETVYRASSMYMLAQYYRAKAGQETDVTLDGLKQIYHYMAELNRCMVKRIRGAIKQDAAVNALVLLDFFVKSFSYSIEDELEEFQGLFRPFLNINADR